MGPAHELLGVDPRQVRGVEVEGDRQAQSAAAGRTDPYLGGYGRVGSIELRTPGHRQQPGVEAGGVPIANSCSGLVPGSW
jgi:hypothetical protein